MPTINKIWQSILLFFKFPPEESLNIIEGRNNVTNVLSLQKLMLLYCGVRGSLSPWIDLSVHKILPLPPIIRESLYGLIDKIVFFLLAGIISLLVHGIILGMYVCCLYFYVYFFHNNKPSWSLANIYKWSYYFSLIFNLIISILYVIVIWFLMVFADYGIIKITINKLGLALDWISISSAILLIPLLCLLKYSSKINSLYIIGIWPWSIFAIYLYPLTFWKLIQKIICPIFNCFTYLISFVYLSFGFIFLIIGIYLKEIPVNMFLYLLILLLSFLPLSVLFFIRWISKRWNNQKLSTNHSSKA